MDPPSTPAFPPSTPSHIPSSTPASPPSTPSHIPPSTPESQRQQSLQRSTDRLRCLMMTDPDERRANANRRSNMCPRDDAPPLPPLLFHGARPPIIHAPPTAANDDPFAVGAVTQAPHLHIPETHLPAGWNAPLHNPIPQNVPPAPPPLLMHWRRNPPSDVVPNTAALQNILPAPPPLRMYRRRNEPSVNAPALEPIAGPSR
ncbi:hypothetical protein H0H93_013141, partial [Arthromyces matolae]